MTDGDDTHGDGTSEINAAHRAFEMVYADLDAGILDRGDALGGLAALLSISSTAPEPTLPRRIDLETLATAARDEVLVHLLPVSERVVSGTDSGDGWIGRLSVGLGETADIAHRFRHQIAVAGLADPGELVGHFLIVRTARGETVVRSFATSVELDDAFDNLAAVWARRRRPVL